LSKGTKNDLTWGIGYHSLENKERLLLVHGNNNALLDGDFDFISFDDSHEYTVDVINDEQYILFLKRQPTMVKDLIDKCFEFFVWEKNLNQIMNLILEEQTNNVLFGKVSNQ
jgi:hypothetical protein